MNLTLFFGVFIFVRDTNSPLFKNRKTEPDLQYGVQQQTERKKLRVQKPKKNTRLEKLYKMSHYVYNSITVFILQTIEQRSAH